MPVGDQTGAIEQALEVCRASGSSNPSSRPAASRTSLQAAGDDVTAVSITPLPDVFADRRWWGRRPATLP
jgi:hypothetical protein